jgi:hypothetical protein
MADQVEICNLALLDVGAKTISAIDEGTTESNVCQDIYELYLKEVLGEHTWDFQKKWVALAAPTVTVNLDERYDYVYQLPSDYLRMSRMQDKKSLYEVRAKQLYTNVEVALIEYIWYASDKIDAQAFPTYFVTAFASRMKSTLAAKLPKKGAKNINFFKTYLEVDLPRAKTADAIQGKPSVQTQFGVTNESDPWFLARG